MDTRIVKDFPDFIQFTDTFDLVADLVLFRGQAKQGNLIPSIARRDPTIDTTESERTVLNQLQLLGASHLSGQSHNELDLLVMAQHFGLKTRLLDWSSNPLVALWFACVDPAPGDAYVYALDADNFQEKDVYSKDPFKTELTKAFQPRQNNPRIIAQHGWFTLHRYSKSRGYFVPLEKNSVAKRSLYEAHIPERKRATILISLERHGVSQRTLFPDLEGLCRHLNWKHQLG